MSTQMKRGYSVLLFCFQKITSSRTLRSLFLFVWDREQQRQSKDGSSHKESKARLESILNQSYYPCLLPSQIVGSVSGVARRRKRIRNQGKQKYMCPDSFLSRNRTISPSVKASTRRSARLCFRSWNNEKIGTFKLIRLPQNATQISRSDFFMDTEDVDFFLSQDSLL